MGPVTLREFEEMVRNDFVGPGPYPTSSKTTPPPSTNPFLAQPTPLTLISKNYKEKSRLHYLLTTHLWTSSSARVEAVAASEPVRTGGRRESVCRQGVIMFEPATLHVI